MKFPAVNVFSVMIRIYSYNTNMIYNIGNAIRMILIWYIPTKAKNAVKQLLKPIGLPAPSGQIWGGGWNLL